MKLRTVLLVAGVAGALLPAVPSHATGGRLCEPGFTGVVVDDPHGELVRACVRTAEAVAIVDGVRDRAVAQVDDLRDWVDAVRGIRCHTTSAAITCDQVPPPPVG
jgi:D-aminopeptidase